jgi:hypothetical protein
MIEFGDIFEGISSQKMNHEHADARPRMARLRT